MTGRLLRTFESENSRKANLFSKGFALNKNERFDKNIKIYFQISDILVKSLRLDLSKVPVKPSRAPNGQIDALAERAPLLLMKSPEK